MQQRSNRDKVSIALVAFLEDYNLPKRNENTAYAFDLVQVGDKVELKKYINK